MWEAKEFREAIVGQCYDPITGDLRLVYSLEKCIILLAEKENISKDSAANWLTYNVVTAYVGSRTPIFIENYKGHECQND